jgi:hypothetical protein
MGSMSASDAAPLPRLGEVFFDVRGSSRSMRLSWYSDTGVAVFSIWQGGTCTGTFRLPIEDLSRMVEALQRGPRGAGLPAADATSVTGPAGLAGLPGGTAARPGLPGGDASVTPFPEYATGQHMAPVTGEFRRPDLGDRDSDRPYGDDPLGSGSYRPPAAPAPVPPAMPAPVPPTPLYSAPPPPSYREDPLTSPSFRDQARSPGYRDSGDRPYGDDPLGSGSYRQPSYQPPPPPAPAPSYQDDPLSSPGYQEPRSTSYRDTGDRPYGDDPLGSGGYRQPSYPPPPGPSAPPYQDSGYPAGDSGYPPVYREGDSGGYPAEEPGGYRGQRYADDPFQSNYPDEARGGSHPYGPPDPEPRSHRGRPSRT